MMTDEAPPFDLRKRTKLFGLRIVEMFVALPKTDAARILGRQVLRSGTSVGANYREAHRARSKADGVRQHGDGVVKRSVTARDIVEGEHCRVPRGRQCEQFIAKIGDCLKELDETSYWIELLTESGIIRPAKVAALMDETNQLLAILTTIAKNAKDTKDS
jgi:hypothetical protein